MTWTKLDDALPADPRTGQRVLPLEFFSDAERAEFTRSNQRPHPPSPFRRTWFGTTANRAHYEWYASRGVNPNDRPPSRPKVRPWHRDAVLKRDGMVCQLCGTEIPEGDLHIDHILPVASGGPTTVDNLQAAHSRCNIAKGARLSEAV